MENTSPSVSVIVPVYNTAKYLDRCIDSLLVQSFNDWEAIFVNDGSTDDSESVLKCRSESCSRIRVITQQNAGSAEARKRGIALAHGKYITFLDSDDTLPIDALATLHHEISTAGVDIVFAALNRIHNNGTRIIGHPLDGILDREQFLSYLLSQNCVCCSGGQMSHRSLWLHDDLFPRKETALPSEDPLTNIKLSEHINRVLLINTPVYNYYCNEGSLSTSGILHKHLSLWKLYYEEITGNLRRRNCLDKFQDKILIDKLEKIVFFMKDYPVSDPWIQNVIKSDVSHLPRRSRILHHLISHPVLCRFAVCANRFIKRRILHFKR